MFMVCFQESCLSKFDRAFLIDKKAGRGLWFLEHQIEWIKLCYRWGEIPENRMAPPAEIKVPPSVKPLN